MFRKLSLYSRLPTMKVYTNLLLKQTRQGSCSRLGLDMLLLTVGLLFYENPRLNFARNVRTNENIASLD